MERLSGKTFDLRTVSLTCKGLHFVNWDRCDDCFEFVGGDKVCCVPSVLAEFLSPKISRIRKCDPFYNVYTFKNDCSEFISALECLVSSLRSGEDFQVENSNFVALIRLSQELENDELLSSLLGMIQTESLKLEEVILLLRAGIEFGTTFSSRFGNLRDFVASHFYEIEKDILDNLDLETIQILLSSHSLKIEDEDSLYDFVKSRSENDIRFASLFEFIYFEYLSVNRIEDFASFARENLLENINTGIWTRICCRLIIDTHLKKNPREIAPPGMKFVYDESKPLEGIIAHLTRKFGGNVHDKGIVNVTSSGFDSSSRLPKNAVDFGTDSRFDQSGSEPQSKWLCYDFKKRRVIPTSYSVRTYDGKYNPKSWLMEVSNDGTENSWTEIDRQDNNDLNARLVTRNFKISKVPSEGFQFIRFRQTGKNHYGNYDIRVNSLEIFGTLFEE